MKQPDVNVIAEHYSAILTEIGADLDTEGMRETPMRAAKAIVEMTEGSRMNTEQLTKMFKAECKKAVCHDMVIVEDIRKWEERQKQLATQGGVRLLSASS